MPIAAVVILLQFTVIWLPMGLFFQFLLGLFLVSVGLILFLLGVHIGLLPVGEMIGSALPKTGKVWMVLLFSFILGFAVTVAEPDVWVLAGYVEMASGQAIPRVVLILTVALGLGLFVLISMVRIITDISINYFLIAGYIIIFVLAFLPYTSDALIPISFDSGGVTTGPMAVPFILAFGVGVASVLKSRTGSQDGFGLVALASIGPVIAVLILGMVYQIPDDIEMKTDGGNYTLLGTLFEVTIALTPLVLFFLFFQFYMLKLKSNQVFQLLGGVLLTLFGMTLFLHGVHSGFQPAGTAMGKNLGELSYNWIIIPIGFVLGFVATFAEPAVRVLNEEVEKVSSGYIPKKVMLYTISIGVSISIALAMTRIIFGLELIYFLVPGYFIAMIMIYFSGREFTSIAFDAGGVATGPMTVTFIVAIALGFSQVQEGSNPLIEGFGMISLVALAPILSVLTLGILYGGRKKN
jgi:hypothetical protein